MILDFSQFLSQSSVSLVLKITFLIVIGIYVIFSLMLTNKIRSFSKILFIPPQGGGGLMQKLTLVYSFVVIIFFFLVLIVL
jgi:hypothetical protein